VIDGSGVADFCARAVADVFSTVLNVSDGFLGEAWLSFYIKPADGYQLPEIMQWVMDISPLSRRSRSVST
jgi:hypothetical protein